MIDQLERFTKITIKDYVPSTGVLFSHFT